MSKSRTIYNSYHPRATPLVIWRIYGMDYRNVLSFILCLLISFLVLSSVISQAKASECTMIYANDVPYSREIKNHEYAHIVCPWWQHPKGFQANGKAYPPPTECLPGKFTGFIPKITPHPVSTKLAYAECKKLRGIAGIGCSKCGG